jgi:hypothetical protein
MLRNDALEDLALSGLGELGSLGDPGDPDGTGDIGRTLLGAWPNPPVLNLEFLFTRNSQKGGIVDFTTVTDDKLRS